MLRDSYPYYLANETQTPITDPAVGGVKESGLGREGIRFAIEDMTEIRLMVMNRIGGNAE